MATISIFLKIFFENIQFILPVAIVFLAVTFVGVSIILTILEERRWDIIFPAGIATGIFGLILLLGNLSYFLKGRIGIAVIFLMYLLLGIFLFKKVSKSLPKISLNYYYKRTIFIYLLFLAFMMFLAGANIYGGDVIAYWGFATSFANGNYPLRSLWQPDILANHHQGTYMFEGAVQALTGVDMLLIHTMYAALVILAGFFLLWGFIRKISKRDFISLLPSLVAYFSFGAIFLALPTFLRSYFVPEVEHVIDHLPLLIDAKDRLGGTSTLPLFIYINHRAAAFLGFLLIFVIIVSKIKVKEFFKPIIVAALSVAVISSDEIFLPAIVFLVLAWFLKQIFTKGQWRQSFTGFLIGGVVAAVLFFSVGNALRDSILTPPKEDSRFQLVLNSESLSKRQGGLKNAILRPKSEERFFWILPDARLIALLAVLVYLVSKNNWSLLLLSSTLGTFIAYFVVDHTYYPNNNDRFLHLIYQQLGLVLASSLVFLLINKNKVVKSLAKVGIIVLLVPSVVFASIFLFKYAKQPYYPNLKGTLPDYKVLKWAQANIPDKRLFFIDGYLRDQPYSYLTLNGIQNYGLFVPISPADVKVHTPDYGVEAIDVINTLNPTPMKKLKIEYLFVVHTLESFYPKQRQLDLNTDRYFSRVYQDQLGILYKVNEDFFNEAEDLTSSIEGLSGIIRNGDIYIDYPPRMESNVRAVMTLALKDKGALYTEWRHGTFNLIETKIELSAPIPNKKYNYLILGPNTNPEEICGCDSYQKIWEMNGAKAFEIK
jgi:hypothetical protein